MCPTVHSVTSGRAFNISYMTSRKSSRLTCLGATQRVSISLANGVSHVFHVLFKWCVLSLSD